MANTFKILLLAEGSAGLNLVQPTLVLLAAFEGSIKKITDMVLCFVITIEIVRLPIMRVMLLLC